MSGEDPRETLNPDEPEPTASDTGRAPLGNRFDPPRSLGGYQLGAMIGRGAHGVVYRARDASLQRDVALKLILPEIGRDPVVRERFINEARSAAGLEHPHIVPIHGSGLEADWLYIAMRYVEGPTLGAAIARSGRMQPAVAAGLVTQIASALEAAHERDIIHGDVKPGNVFLAEVDGADHAYLGDFGLSVTTSDTAAPDRGPIGTPGYAAPEQILRRALDQRADVYGLGALLFFMLVGRSPFESTTRDETFRRQLAGAPPAIPEDIGALPAATAALFGRALAFDREERVSSASELADAARALGYDVVAAGSEGDPGAAALLAQLRETGVDVVAPGVALVEDDRLPALLRSARACLLVVGRRGLGSWARATLPAVRARAKADPSFAVATVLLPGSPPPHDPGLAGVADFPWIEFPEARSEWPSALAQVRRVIGAPGPRPLKSELHGRCPYQGLDAFDAESAPFFFGREFEVRSALERLDRRPLLAVLGPSGCGKSSFLQAGLAPALSHDGDSRPLVILTPGERPLASLIRALAETALDSTPTRERLLAQPESLEEALAADRDDRLTIIVDQFEEILTIASDEAERHAFVEALLHSATVPGGHTRLVIGMRLDFLEPCAAIPRIRGVLSEHQFLLGPLTERELRRAIEEPALKVGCEVEPGLVRLMLEDVAGRSAALPLLQFTLLELWRRRQGNLLTAAAYSEVGGVSGALARRADELYERLGSTEKDVARAVLLRLIRPGDGTEDTRRRVQLAELVGLDGHEPARVSATVDALIRARLLVATTEPEAGVTSVEMAHEALIRAWPRLRTWIESDRERLRLERKVAEAAREWAEADEPHELLYRGSLLAAWEERGRGGLSAREQRFLDASSDQARSVARAAARRRWAAASAITAVVILSLVAIAMVAGLRSALSSRDNAVASEQVARAGAAALEAQSALALPGDRRDLPATAATALEAVEGGGGRVAERVLRAVLDEWGVPEVVGRADADARRVAFSPDGRFVATLGNGVEVHEASGDEAARFSGVRGVLDASGRIIFLDGHFVGERSLLAAGRIGSVMRLEVRGSELIPAAEYQGATGVISAIAARDDLVVAGLQAGGVVAWDRVEASPRRLQHPASVAVRALDLAPDGSQIATGDDSGRLRIFPTAPGPLVTVEVARAPIAAIAYDRRGDLLVATRDGTLERRSEDGALRRRLRTGRTIVGLRLSPDGSRALLVLEDASGSRSLEVRELRRFTPLYTFGGPGESILDAAFGPGGRRLVSLSDDGLVRMRDLASRPRIIRPGARRARPPQILSVRGDSVLAPGADARTLAVIGLDGSGPRARWRLEAEPDAAELVDAERAVAITSGRLVILQQGRGPQPVANGGAAAAGRGLVALAVGDDGTVAIGDAAGQVASGRVSPAGSWAGAPLVRTTTGARTLDLARPGGALRVAAPAAGGQLGIPRSPRRVTHDPAPPRARRRGIRRSIGPSRGSRGRGGIRLRATRAPRPRRISGAGDATRGSPRAGHLARLLLPLPLARGGQQRRSCSAVGARRVPHARAGARRRVPAALRPR